MDSKGKYRALCGKKCIRIFSQPWWLDAVAGQENWDVIIIENEHDIVAAFPYCIQKKYIFEYISMPKLTPMMGAWINYPSEMKYSSKLYFENEIYNEIISRLPEVNYFNYCFDYSFNNWLPFYWKNFKQTTLYSYVIEDLSDLDGIYRNFNSNVKRNIKKAQKELEISLDENIETFFNINKLTFERQGLKIPYSLDYLKKIDEACSSNNCKQIFVAKDKQGNYHAALYIVWDDVSAYYLMGGADPKFRNSGAASYLLWESIQFCSTRTKQYDFEGSIIKPIGEFFRSFGGTQKPYFKISKTNSRLLKLREFFKDFL